MTNNKVASYAERLGNLQDAFKADVGALMDEAKEHELDPATLRYVTRELRMDAAKRAERDDKRERYLHAVGLAVDLVRDQGLSLRRAEEITGASKSSIQRALAVPAVSQDHREMVADDLGDPLWVVDRDRAKFREKIKRIASTVKPQPELMAALQTILADDLAIPDFLRRTQAAA